IPNFNPYVRKLPPNITVGGRDQGGNKYYTSVLLRGITGLVQGKRRNEACTIPPFTRTRTVRGGRGGRTLPEREIKPRHHQQGVDDVHEVFLRNHTVEQPAHRDAERHHGRELHRRFQDRPVYQTARHI